MQKIKSRSFIMQVFKGVGINVLCVLAFVLIFAGVVSIANLSTGVIKPVNQFIKILAIFIGCFFSLKGSLGFVKGGLVGVLGTFVNYVIFAIIGGSAFISVSILIDLIIAFLIGLVSGIITVNIRKGDASH